MRPFAIPSFPVQAQVLVWRARTGCWGWTQTKDSKENLGWGLLQPNPSRTSEDGGLQGSARTNMVPQRLQQEAQRHNEQYLWSCPSFSLCFRKHQGAPSSAVCVLLSASGACDDALTLSCLLTGVNQQEAMEQARRSKEVRGSSGQAPPGQVRVSRMHPHVHSLDHLR